jgi:DNA-binding transcriptional LysR family regulator
MADPDALGLLPAHALDEELRQGTLVEVDVEPPLPSICLEAIWRQGTPLPARARTLVDGLRDLALARVAHPA